MDKKVIIGFVVVIVLILGGIVYATSRTSTSGGPDLSVFAQCLKDKGATFYGAFWCPHCQATKRMFGAGASKLPYVECSTPDGNGQTQVCIDKGIKQYPTWYFADGSSLSGELTLAQLSSKTGCVVPGSETAEPSTSVSPTSNESTSVVSTTTSQSTTPTSTSSATVNGSASSVINFTQ